MRESLQSLQQACLEATQTTGIQKDLKRAFAINLQHAYDLGVADTERRLKQPEPTFQPPQPLTPEEQKPSEPKKQETTQSKPEPTPPKAKTK